MQSLMMIGCEWKSISTLKVWWQTQQLQEQAQLQWLFAEIEHPRRHWPCDWTRNQCVTAAQLCTGHSLLLAAYLHRIGWWDSDTCPHCNGADETAEHLVLHCPAHDQARRESWPNLHYQSDPRCLWSFLEKIGEVTRPPDREQEREYNNKNKIRGNWGPISGSNKMFYKHFSINQSILFLL